MIAFDFEAVARQLKKPPVTTTASVFWRDPYISAHVLNAHLDPQSDAGSRPPERIAEEVRLILAALDLEMRPEGTNRNHPPCLLDLGCGPGLYAREFARHGLRVVGMDFSPASIDHAQRLNRRSGRCAFHLCDFTRAAYPRSIDGAVMIYGIFGNLSERQRDAVLRRLYKTLPVGGRFVFDVFSESWARRHALKSDWFVSTKNGFWMPGPHLVLECSWFYDAARTVLNAYHVIDENGTMQRHIVRHRWTDEDELETILRRSGFKPLQMQRVNDEWLFAAGEKQ